MAKCTAGPVISNIAGSIGGLTFRNDKSGLVLSLKQQPTRKQSDAQLEHRLFFSEGARAWSALDADIQLAWNVLAKSERIPSFFSRGRTWSGRQMFQCFYTYARHQMTPLPGRWLPTPPLFFETAFSNAAIFYRVSLENENPPPDYFYYETSVIQGRYPDSTDPFSGPSSHARGACSIFGAFGALNRPAGPRALTRIAPATPALLSGLGYTPNSYKGHSFGGWSPVLKAILGFPPGTDPSTTDYFTAQWTFYLRTFQVTNERLYYSPLLKGSCDLGYGSIGRTEAYFGEYGFDPTPAFSILDDTPYIPHV